MHADDGSLTPRTGCPNWRTRIVPSSSTYPEGDAWSGIRYPGRGREEAVLERSSLKDTASITSSGNDLILEVAHQTLRAPAIRVVSRSGGATDFVLVVPGKPGRCRRHPQRLRTPVRPVSPRRTRGLARRPTPRRPRRGARYRPGRGGCRANAGVTIPLRPPTGFTAADCVLG